MPPWDHKQRSLAKNWRKQCSTLASRFQKMAQADFPTCRPLILIITTRLLSFQLPQIDWEILHEFNLCLLLKNYNMCLFGKFILKFIYEHSIWMETMSSFPNNSTSLLWKSYAVANTSLLSLLLCFQVTSQSQTVCILKANIHKMSASRFAEAPENWALMMYELNWCLEYEAQINWKKKVIALEFWPTLMYWVPMSLLFLIFWPTVRVRSFSPRAPPTRPSWKSSQSRAKVWGLLKWFSF